MSLTAYERETVITFNDSEAHALVTTWQRSIITKLSRNPAAERIEDLQFDKLNGATFKIPKELVSFRSGKRTVTLTPEQRAEAGQRPRAGRIQSDSIAVTGETRAAA